MKHAVFPAGLPREGQREDLGEVALSPRGALGIKTRCLNLIKEKDLEVRPLFKASLGLQKTQNLSTESCTAKVSSRAYFQRALSSSCPVGPTGTLLEVQLKGDRSLSSLMANHQSWAFQARVQVFQNFPQTHSTDRKADPDVTCVGHHSKDLIQSWSLYLH
jgi:hypothetical protein